MKFLLLVLLPFTVFAQSGGNTFSIPVAGGSLLGILIGGLVTYFFSTRNLESQMTKAAKKEIDIHNKIEHKENMYDVNDRDIARHKKECGEKLEKSLEEVKKSVHDMELRQGKMEVILSNVSININKIANKMNIITDGG